MTRRRAGSAGWVTRSGNHGPFGKKDLSCSGACGQRFGDSGEIRRSTGEERLQLKWFAAAARIDVQV
jgi:hypothetical protein